MPAPLCLVCRSTTSIHCLDLKISGGKVPYFRCQECTLVFQDPATPFKAEEIYNAEYIQKRSQDPRAPHTTRPREKTAEHYYRWVEKFTSKGTLLEVGCATGIALKVARKRGWKVSGVEVNEQAALVAKEVLNDDVVKAGHLHDKMFPDKHFSLITLFDVIEHIPDPVKFLALLHKKTAPGGHIFLLTPDVDTLSFKIMKEKWPHFVQEHLALFSRKSMQRLLKESGFAPKTHGWGTKYISMEMLKTHAEHHPSPLYKSIGWILGKTPGSRIVFPFNMGEMFILAQKIS